jgi:glutamate dehydrogenase
MRRLLDIDGETVTGEELVRQILRARVDLLYNGGIGTYVKASQEEQAEVGDRANDRVRVNGFDLRARVVAEGGNLGFTQRARLEYWAAGGLINTDAVDNSGGVDMSDHEVNLKILMDVLIARGRLSGRDERNRILQQLAEDVAALVLADNAGQSRALTLDGLRSARDYEAFVGLLEELCAARVLDPVEDVIPARDELLGWRSQERGLPRPLLAVALGQVKRWARDGLLASRFPDREEGRPFLEAYFPQPLRERYAPFFHEHALRREIIATVSVNHLVNHAGIRFLPWLVRTSGSDIGSIVAAYVAAEAECGAVGLRSEVMAARSRAQDEHSRLLQVEDALAEAVAARLRVPGQERGQAQLTWP